VTSLARRPSWQQPSAAAALPILIVVVGALARDLRPVALVALMAGAVISFVRDEDARWLWAACLPVSVNLAWGLLPTPLADPRGDDCGNPLSPPAVWRVAEAVLVLAATVIIAWRLREKRAGIGLRAPSRIVIAAAGAAFVVFGPLGLLLGATLAAPFFGSFALDVGQVGAVVPALLFAVSNGTMEEIVYRGACMTWAARVVGLLPAVALQAVLFGLAHGGPDFVGNPAPVMLAMSAGAVVAAAIAIRTRSLLLPIAAHVALDLPLYYYFACRAA